MENSDLKYFNIRCDSGLCNRLRFIFSWLHAARERNYNLKVYWIKNDHCNGYFLDVFQKVENINFTEDINEKYIEVKQCNPHRDYRPNLKFVYKDLVLLPNIQYKVDSFLKGIGEFDAIHMRKTDFKNKIYDNNYENFINKSDKKVFIATDNAITQNKFKNKFKDKVFYFKEIVQRDSLRQTDLELAAIDLFISIRSRNFKGTYGSSFSQFIKNYKEKCNELV